jgi:hypothetical protein
LRREVELPHELADPSDRFAKVVAQFGLIAVLADQPVL